MNANGQRTRQSIVDAALALFAEKGYFGTSLRDIATVVGVRESALYNYFPGKEALFDALIESVRASREEQVADVVGQGDDDPQHLLERLALSILQEFCAPRSQQLFRVLMQDGQRLARDGRINLMARLSGRTMPLHALMRGFVARGLLRRQDTRVLVLEFLGPLLMWRHGHAINPRAGLVVNRKTFAREHVSHFLRGAAPAATAPRAARPIGGARAHRRTARGSAQRAPHAR